MPFSKSSKLSLLIIISLVVSALVSEIALRIIKLPQLSYGDNLPLVYQKDEELGFKFIPNSEGVYKRYFEWETDIKINSHGWRDYEYPYEKKDGVYRIAVIGDSFTANMETPLDKTYTKVLEKLLQNNISKQIEVLSFAIDGTGTDYHYKVLKQYALKYHPDMIIHAFFYNDIADVQQGKLYRSIYHGRLIQYQNQKELDRAKQNIDKIFYTPWGITKDFILKNSFLARLLMYPFGVRWPHFYIMTTYYHRLAHYPAEYLKDRDYFSGY